MSRRGARLAAVALLLVSTAFSLAVAEAAVRALDSFESLRGAAFADPSGSLDSADGALLPHPYRGWMRIAGEEPGLGAFPTPWSRAERRTNRLGFRSAIDDPRGLAEEDFVVGLAGGSVANGVVVYGGDRFVAELERRRPELAGRVRVLNFGSGGYKQPQQVTTLVEALVLGVPLDAIVNLDGYNEVALGYANVDGGVHPYFPSWLHYASTIGLAGGFGAHADLVAAAEIVGLEERAAGIRRRFAATPLVRSHLAQAAVGWVAGGYERRARQLEIAFQEAHGDVVEGLPVLAAPCLELEDLAARRAACLPLVVDAWYRSSLALEALARGYGLAYVHALQPNQHLAGTKPLSAEERERFFEPEHPWSLAYAEGYPLLAARGAELRRAGVAFRDLTGIFATHRETLYVDACCHLGVRGNRLLAARLAALLAGEIAAAERRPRAQRGAAPRAADTVSATQSLPAAL